MRKKTHLYGEIHVSCVMVTPSDFFAKTKEVHQRVKEVKTHQQTPLESYRSSPDVLRRLSKA